MASLLCSKCKTGIRYHGEPEGIEYVVITMRDWDNITSSRFDAKEKQFLEGSKIPKLFRTDTIETDFADSIQKVWRCPECGALMLFDNGGKVVEVFEEDDECEYSVDEVISTFVVFDDYTWTSLCDSMVPDREVADKYQPSFYAAKENERITVRSIGGDYSIMYRKVIV